jgi:hypothetical protein
VPFNVHSVDAGFSEALRWHLAPFRRPALEAASVPVYVYRHEDDGRTTAKPRYAYLRDGYYGTTGYLEEMLWLAVADVYQVVGQTTRDFLLLHAGSVARGGDGLFLPAEPDAGKSTLVTALLSSGFDYLSDEFGAIDPITRRAYPVQKRIALNQDALRFFPGLEGRMSDRARLSETLSQRFARPEDMGARVAQPVRTRWVVFPSADWEGPPRLRPLTKAEAAERMAEKSLNLYRFADEGVLLLTEVAREAESFALDGGTPVERAALLSEALRRPV